jgi:peptidoglycan/LPS O-acetylase OafA/YrhL
MTAGARYIPALDGLRGLAALLVVLRHVYHLGGYDRIGLPEFLACFLANGWVGVDLFFVLSGYLITRSLFARGGVVWRTYLIKRLLRIVPAYYVVLLLAAAGMFPFYTVPAPDRAVSVGYHLLFLQDYLPANLVVAFWSLGVEEKFYLLAPLLVLLTLRLKSAARHYQLLGALLLLGPLLRFLTFLLMGTPPDYPTFFVLYRSPFHACIDALLWGVLIARMEHSGFHLVKGQARLVLLTGFAALVLVLANVPLLTDFGWFEAVLQPSLISFIMALLVAGAVFGGHSAALLTSAPIAVGGADFIQPVSGACAAAGAGVGPVRPSGFGPAGRRGRCCRFIWGCRWPGPQLLYTSG